MTNSERMKVGDIVITRDGQEGYVLIPDYSQNGCVLLMEDYSCPQIVRRSKVEKTGNCNETIRRFIRLAAESLKHEAEE